MCIRDFLTAAEQYFLISRQNNEFLYSNTERIYYFILFPTEIRSFTTLTQEMRSRVSAIIAVPMRACYSTW